MTDLPATWQIPVSASGSRTQESMDTSHSMRANRQPAADDVDLPDNGLHRTKAKPVINMRLRLLIPVAAAVLFSAGFATSSYISERNDRPGGLGAAAVGAPPPGNSGIGGVQPGREVLAAGNDDGTIRLWDTANPAPSQGLLCLLVGGGTGNSVGSVAFSPDGEVLAAGNEDGTIRLWDTANPAHPRESPVSLSAGTGNSVGSVAFSPDGKVLAAGNEDGTIRLWDTTDPAHPIEFPIFLSAGEFNQVDSVAFSPDGKVLAAGNEDGTIRLWDTTDPAHPIEFPIFLSAGEFNQVDSVAFSPDGKSSRLATMTARSGSGIPPILPISGNFVSPCRQVRETPWDRWRSARTGKSSRLATKTARSGSGIPPILPISGNFVSPCRQVRETPWDRWRSADGKVLAAGNEDGTIRFWNVTTGQLLASDLLRDSKRGHHDRTGGRRRRGRGLVRARL